MTAPLSRRAALAGAVAMVPALTGPSLAAAPSLTLQSPPDPILAAIERHKKAFDIFADASVAADENASEANEAALARATAAEREALDALYQTPPQTAAGMRAAVAHFVEYDMGCVPECSGRFLSTLLRSPVLAG